MSFCGLLSLPHHERHLMKSGQILEQGKGDQIFNSPREQYTQDLLSASLLVNEN